MLVPGTLLNGRYRVVRLFKRGGMAFLYEGLDIRSGLRIAIKVLRPELHQFPELSERLRHEGIILAKLRHPNIVRYIDFRQEENLSYLILQWVPGHSLRYHIARRNRPYALREISSWVEDVLRALIYLEDRGIVHRDLKPGNIIITPENRAILVDFSISLDRRIASWDPLRSSYIGTSDYAAPEQMQGRLVDQRADIYSLGTIIFELLTLQRPFNYGGDDQSSHSWHNLLAIKSRIPPRSLTSYVSDLNPSVAQLVERMLAPSPEERPQSAREVWEIWESVVGGGRAPHEVPPVAQPARPKKLSRVRRNYLGLFVTVALVLIAFVVGTYVFQATTATTKMWIGRCQEVPLEIAGARVQWETCINTAEISSSTLRLDVSWKAAISPDSVVLTKESDSGNKNMYLIDAAGRRYDHIRVGGDAARDVDIRNGQEIRGWFEFPRPRDMRGRMKFVDDDVGVHIWFRVR